MAETEALGEQDLTEGNDRFKDIVSRHRPDTIKKVDQQDQHISFVSENQIELVITLITPEILQLTYYLEGDVRSDFSYAVDPGFEASPVDYTLTEQKNRYLIETEALIAKISKKKLLVSFYDQEGNILCEDEDGFSRRESLMEGISELTVTKKAPNGVTYFGLGDKTVDADLRGRTYTNWNTDSFGYERGDDPLYRSIPFYLALFEGRGYGIFLDNTYRSRFSFDHKKNRTSSFSASGGVMNYYFIYGPELSAVTGRYTRLTGTPHMPPMWALGYHQCRWSYFPESRVLELAETFREKKIPCDSIYLDIDYMDEYRCFTWNTEHFPKPKEMIRRLKEQGFHTVVMIDPGIKVDNNYFVYQQGTQNGHFCKRPDGERVIAPVWAPECAFPDFTNPQTREWWGDLYDDFMNSMEVSGIWNDMNEPAVFEVKRKTFPDDIRHDYDGHPCSHKKAHNIYGMQMARASLEGIRKHAPSKRPFLLTRANFSGGQRYAALWTGDNIATWDHLKLANEQCQRLSISGYSFVGSDIGGFVDNPDAELFTRWLQLGVFHPLYRNHTMGYNVDGAAAVKQEEVAKKKAKTVNEQEPWVFGEKFTAINREIIMLRYRLLRYLYTAFRKYITQGTPVLKPLAYYDQSDAEAVSQNDVFLFGDHILVAPVLDKKKTEVNAYLPRGEWYHFWDHQKMEGGQYIEVDAPLERIPFFIKEGTVLPLRETMQYTGERVPEKLELHVYYSEKPSKSMLYEDAGEGWQYQEGAFRETCFCLEADTGEKLLRLTADRTGSFKPSYSFIQITLIGLPFEMTSANVDGKATAVTKTEEDTNHVLYELNVQPGFETITFS